MSDKSLYKRKVRGTERHQGAGPVRQAEIAVMLPQAEERLQPSDAGRGEDQILPWAFGGRAPCPHLDLGPVILTSDFWPPKL